MDSGGLEGLDGHLSRPQTQRHVAPGMLPQPAAGLIKVMFGHQSQLPGYGPLVELPRESLLRFWSEATFVRVYSLVNNGRKVETDLFEGLR